MTGFSRAWLTECPLCGPVPPPAQLLRDSIAYALAHRQEALDYALQFGRGLDRSKADRFVGMYVNELTLDYGDRGRAAVQRLFDEAWQERLIPQKIDAEFSA